jgi:hypothetical protein
MEANVDLLLLFRLIKFSEQLRYSCLVLVRVEVH